MNRRHAIAALLLAGALLLLGGRFAPVALISRPNSLVAIVEESSDRDAALAIALGNAAYWDGLAARQLRWKIYDRDATDAQAILAAGNAAGLPAVVVADASGAILAARKLTAKTTDEIDSVVRRATGL